MTKEQNFYDWNWDHRTTHNLNFHGRGIKGAFEAGARQALRGEKFDNIYSRNDCRTAYVAGYSDMMETLKDTVIVCDDCGSKIDRRSRK